MVMVSIVTQGMQEVMHLMCATLGYVFLSICVVLSYSTEAYRCISKLLSSAITSAECGADKKANQKRDAENNRKILLNSSSGSASSSDDEDDLVLDSPNSNTDNIIALGDAALREEPIVSNDLRDYVNAEGDLQCEVHIIQTSPTQFVETLRVFHKTCDLKTAQPVVLQHGLLQRNGVFVTSGSRSLAFVIARSGNFDVWLPDTRNGGGVLKETEEKNSAPWNWGMAELADDFVAIIKYVHQKCQSNKKPIYCGHSQGATQALLAMAKDPEVSKQLAGFAGLAPAFFLKAQKGNGPMPRLCRTTVATRETIFGTGAFLPLMTVAQRLFPAVLFGSLGGHMFEYLFDWRRNLWPAGQDIAFFQWTPSVVSSKLVSEWVTSLARGCVSETAMAPACHCPVAIISGADDSLVDGNRLAKEMKVKMAAESATSQKKMFMSIDVEGYSHLDVIWAKDAPEKAFVPLVKFIESCCQ